ncbi:MAG: bifunctional isocitrate dehydrogenase kinase/phosphatase [Acidimicrobiia bacterium]|nr:MAG: bifunctional isocitrate dehydrogenase kinase/phosphatase [Acidimicrobiia bacterium]
MSLTPPQIATLIAIGFQSYRRQFQSTTRRAAARFESRDWVSIRRDNLERRDAYGIALDETIQSVTDAGYRTHDREAWSAAKALYRTEHGADPYQEIAETFFNSVARRLFATAGIDPELEFLAPPPSSDITSIRPMVRVYEKPPDVRTLLEDLLRDCRFHASWEDRHRDLDRALDLMPELPDRVEVVDQLFYRGKGAYVVGRIYHGSDQTPFALAIRHGRSGLSLGAILVGDEDLAILFSYTRAAFLVSVDIPGELVAFLAELLPWRKASEIYASIGFRKHSKTERYRDLSRYLENSTDQFEYSEGIPGLVMIVFTLPGYDVVFKVIRDHFPPQKNVTPDTVARNYRLVARHDRAGRLVEAQRFVDLRLPVARFDHEVLDELLTEASRTVSESDNQVTIKTVYLERRVTPLDIFLREADVEAASRAIVGYGTAIKNLAATNIFPGDMLLKNFGVTSRGRIVFYDYDEISALTDCKFRRFPVSDDPIDELSSTPSFGVGPNDVFPEELPRFLGLSKELRSVLDVYHADLFGVEFWHAVQGRLEAGEIIEILPYKRSRTLDERGVGGTRDER